MSPFIFVHIRLGKITFGASVEMKLSWLDYVVMLDSMDLSYVGFCDAFTVSYCLFHGLNHQIIWKLAH